MGVANVEKSTSLARRQGVPSDSSLRVITMAEAPFQRTIGEWEAEFRSARDRHLLPQAPELIERCRRRFGEISAITRRHRQDGRLERPEYSALRTLSYECLLLTRLAHQELAQFDLSDGPTVAVELLERLLIENRSRLRTIDSQLNLIESTVSLAEVLRPVIEGVLSEDGFPARKFEPLLQQLEPRQLREKVDQLVPWPGVSFELIFEQAGWRHPWFYAQTIHNARWTAAVRSGLADDDFYPRTGPIAAALLADVGLLVTALTMRGMPFRKDPRGAAAFRRHPDISAAVISGISGASPEWALLAGQHHERLDGSGFPEGCSGRQLSSATRGFTAALRWSELLLQSSTAVTATEALAVSAEALWRETQRGAFDASIVTRMFSVVHAEWAAALPAGDLSQIKVLLDPAHALSGPHHAVGVGADDEHSSHAPIGPPSPKYMRHVRQHAHRGHLLSLPLNRPRTALSTASGT